MSVSVPLSMSLSVFELLPCHFTILPIQPRLPPLLLTLLLSTCTDSDTGRYDDKIRDDGGSGRGSSSYRNSGGVDTIRRDVMIEVVMW